MADFAAYLASSTPDYAPKFKELTFYYSILETYYSILETVTLWKMMKQPFEWLRLFDLKAVKMKGVEFVNLKNI